MPRNVEIKARVDPSLFESLRNTAKELSGSEQLLTQTDTFYNVVNTGRLKLREEEVTPKGDATGPNAKLIFYERPDQEGPKLSDYSIALIDDSKGLKDVLQQALGTRGIVKKKRWLYLVGQTRIHVDDVEGLGKFMELEVVLKDDQSSEEGEAIACQLMETLGITKENLLTGAYMDLLEKD